MNDAPQICNCGVRRAQKKHKIISYYHNFKVQKKKKWIIEILRFFGQIIVNFGKLLRKKEFIADLKQDIVLTIEFIRTKL